MRGDETVRLNVLMRRLCNHVYMAELPKPDDLARAPPPFHSGLTFTLSPRQGLTQIHLNGFNKVTEQ